MRRAARRVWRIPASPSHERRLARHTLSPEVSKPQRYIGPSAIQRAPKAIVSRARAYSSPARPPEPTIYALSTAPGRAAIAIIRLSGHHCLDVYRSLCPGKADPKPRYATLRTLYDHSAGPTEVLDSNALVLYFPGPRTVTGEDVLELHVHGGPAVVKAMLAAISRCNETTSTTGRKIRYAEPGEFTRRAFLNDRLDLTQVEALGDTLSATTEQQRRLSVRGTTGVLAKQYEDWRRRLLYARGELEAFIDFSEDQHFDESPSELCASVAEQIVALRRMLRVHSQNAVKGEFLRNGISISLLGAPNAGKSSLLNRIIGREAAIVSQEAGTTRDVVEIGLDIGGYLCRLGDTAGLRKALVQNAASSVQHSSTSRYFIGEVEQEGMRRAKARAAESDVVLVVLSFENTNKEATLHLDPEVIATASQICASKNNILVALNKADLATTQAQHASAIQAILKAIPGLSADRIHLISCKADTFSGPSDSHTSAQHTHAGADGAGNIPALLNALIGHFGLLTAASTPGSDGADDPDPSIWQESLGASERHRVLLERCVDALDAFLAEVGGGGSSEVHSGIDDGSGRGEGEADIVVAAEHLRSAADCLSKITGRGEAGDVEEVLGVVFEKFCVGK